MLLHTGWCPLPLPDIGQSKHSYGRNCGVIVKFFVRYAALRSMHIYEILPRQRQTRPPRTLAGDTPAATLKACGG